jgi:hypothetical protein
MVFAPIGKLFMKNVGRRLESTMVKDKTSRLYQGVPEAKRQAMNPRQSYWFVTRSVCAWDECTLRLSTDVWSITVAH